MKLKLSFDKNAIKEFLLEHAEKFVFAGVVVCFLALVSGAVWASRYDRTADELQALADRAADFIDKIPVQPDAEATPFAQMIQNNQPPKPESYGFVQVPKPRLVNPMELRGEPPVLLVRELRGSADYAPFNLRITRATGAETGRRFAQEVAQGVQGQRWAVITGLVPLREQEQAYEEYFRDRIKPTPEPDVVDYIYYRVERAEVDPYLSPSDPEQLKWTPLNLRNALTEAEKTWTGTSPEVVDERFVHPRLVFPLGPKVAEQERAQGFAFAGGEGGMFAGEMHGGSEPAGPWGEEVAHPPQIPLRRHRPGEGMEGDIPPGEGGLEPGADVPDIDRPWRGEEGMYPGAAPGMRRPTAPRAMPGEGMMRPGPGGMARPGPGGRMEMYPGEGMGMYDQTPEHLLFRFFDYSVEYGKSYRYRVRLMVANPNYGLDPKFLEDPELAKRQWVEKDRWSEPTPVITIPRDTYVLAGGVHTLIRPTDEPSGTIAVVKWREDIGEEVNKDFRVTRGQLLDYPDVVIRDPKRNRRDAAPQIRPAGNLLDVMGRETPADEPEKVDFLTEMITLDLMGGTRLPGRDRSLTDPGRLLVMDYDGTLRMLSEIDDSREFERRTSEPETPDSELDMPGMGYEEGMMEEMMLEGGPPPRGRRPPRGTPMGSP